MVTMRGAAEATAGVLVRLCCSAELKIEPRAAMPAAMPICRNVELTPDAIPAFCGGTTPIAVEASGGLTRPPPRPATMNPGIRCVQSLAPVRSEEHTSELQSRPHL